MVFETGLPGKDGVRTFEQFLVNAGEGADPDNIIGLTADGMACGALQGHEADGVFVIDSIYVAPEVRRQGGGTMLLDSLLEGLEAAGTDIPVSISFAEADEDTEALYDFLLSRGYAEGQVDKAVYLVPAEDIDPGIGDDGCAVSFSSCEESEIAALEKKVIGTGIGISEETLERADRSVSTVYVKDRAIEAILMAEQTDNNLWTVYGGTMVKKAADAYKKALGATAVKALDQMNINGELMVMAWIDEEKKAIEELFPESEDIYHSFMIV